MYSGVVDIGEKVTMYVFAVLTFGPLGGVRCMWCEEGLQRREYWSLREKAITVFFYSAVVGNFCTGVWVV